MTAIDPLPILLDASALLALLHREPGEAIVADVLLSGAVISAVNYAEVLTKLVQRGASARSAERRVRRVVAHRLRVEPIMEEDAVHAAALSKWSQALAFRWGTGPASPSPLDSVREC